MSKKFFKKRDLIIILVLLAVCAAGLLLIPRGPKGNVAVVSVNGVETQRIDLSRDGEYHIDALLPVTLEVKDKRIRFVNSQCPDLLCEHFGFIGEEYKYAICMPAGVTVVISAD